MPIFETEESQKPSNLSILGRMEIETKATYFRCGGLAVAIVLSRKIADALSHILFVNTWSAVARGDGGSVTLPTFDASYAPPLPDFDATTLSRGVPDAGVTQQEIANKIITFSASEIAALQERYTVGGNRPSRAEALSAFIWTRGNEVFDCSLLWFDETPRFSPK
ncbi:shikimate O-hydroxycinnamoyltransferase [Salvia divinorum]|uniref:Shikimate O-hydroxycinnamoyltransferase n=1 Tax=Salvia divinorum TaxID=28513 RepID=A0ABD1FLD9_SALDI